jgi:hypothetical protein
MIILIVVIVIIVLCAVIVFLIRLWTETKGDLMRQTQAATRADHNAARQKRIANDQKQRCAALGEYLTSALATGKGIDEVKAQVGQLLAWVQQPELEAPPARHRVDGPSPVASVMPPPPPAADQHGHYAHPYPAGTPNSPSYPYLVPDAETASWSDADTA